MQHAITDYWTESDLRSLIFIEAYKVYYYYFFSVCDL